MVIAYGNFIEAPSSTTMDLHEEADTLLANQAMDAGENSTIDVWSPDTDVFLLLMDLVANDRLGAGSQLAFITGKDAKRRRIDVDFM